MACVICVSCWEASHCIACVLTLHEMNKSKEYLLFPSLVFFYKKKNTVLFLCNQQIQGEFASRYVNVHVFSLSLLETYEVILLQP